MEEQHSNLGLFRGQLTIRHVAALLLLVWAAFSIGSRVHRSSDQPFDQDKWAQAPWPKDKVTRFTMRKDVVARLNAGKPSIDEVFQMLGTPEGWAQGANETTRNGGLLRYPLGTNPAGFFSLAQGWLLDVYCGDGRVIDAKVHGD